MASLRTGKTTPGSPSTQQYANLDKQALVKLVKQLSRNLKKYQQLMKQQPPPASADQARADQAELVVQYKERNRQLTAQLKDTIIKANGEFKKLKLEIQAHKDRVEELEHRFLDDALSNSGEAAATTLASPTAVEEQLQQCMAAKDAQCKKKALELTKMRTDMDALQTQLAASEAKRKSLWKKTQQQQQQQQQQQKQEEGEEAVARLRQEYEDRFKQLEVDYKNERDTLKANFDEHNRALDQQNKQLTADIQREKETQRQSDIVTKQLKASASDIKRKHDKILSDLEFARVRITELEDGQKQSENVVNAKLDHAADALAAVRTNLENALRENRERTAQVTALEETVATKDGTIQQQEQTIHKLEKTIQDMNDSNADINALRDQHTEDRHTLTEKITELQATVASQQEQLLAEIEQRKEEQNDYEREREANMRVREREDEEKQQEFETKWDEINKEKQKFEQLSTLLQTELANLQAETHSLESELASVKATLAAQEEELHMLRESSAAAVAEANDCTEVKQTHLDTIAALEDKLASIEETHAASVSDMEGKHNDRYERLLRELKTVKDQNSRKMYQLQTELRASEDARAKLQDEVTHGAPSERRMLELAAIQAQRDQHAHERNMEIQDLKDKIAEYDDVVKKQEQQKRFLAGEIRKLQQSRKRARVDIDYLKNVLVRLIQFDSKVDERKALYPVIATIMHFGPEDYKAIEEAAPHLTQRQEESWLSWITGTSTPVVPKQFGMTTPSTFPKIRTRGKGREGDPPDQRSADVAAEPTLDSTPARQLDMDEGIGLEHDKNNNDK